MESYIKNIIISDEKLEGLFTSLIERDKHIWNKFGGNPTEIFKWLHNFDDKESYHYALILANKISYYNSKQIRYLWGHILNNKIKSYLIQNVFNAQQINAIDKWFNNYLTNFCLFVSFGEASKSGPFMLYKFRQANNDKNLVYMESSEFLNVRKMKENYPDKEVIFLIDDFLGCGKQAQNFWHKKINNVSFYKFSKKNIHLKFIYLGLVGCLEGKNLLESEYPIKVILGETLDNSFKCFSENSIIFTKAVQKDNARKIMSLKGKMLFRKHPLGYNDMQLAIAFEHNTPNNSLPVIWKNKSNEWFPLFERFE